jgi:predicted peptidase
MMRGLIQLLIDSAAMAILTAAVSSAAGADEKVATERGPDPQKSEHFEREITITVKLDYLLYLPAGYDDEKKVWPLLVFLHGSGERGDDLEKVKVHGPPKLIAEGKPLPFIVVSPQAPRRRWDPATLNALLDDLVAKHRVDKNRIYLTGLSMGGAGTWTLAGAYPERFAAIVPICGGGDPADAPKLKDIPVWVFHGAKDEAVPVSRSEEMVKALREAGATTVEFTVYPDAEHDSWTDTYANPKLYEWLLQQRRTR